MPSSYALARPRRAIAALAALTLVTTLAGPAAAAPGGQGKAGFKTSIDAMLTPLAAGASVEALISSGDTLGGGYRFEAIPDGIALQARGAGRVDLYVNHETSLVPFPYNPPFGGPMPTEANLNDFENSQVSHLALNRNSAGILSGKYAIASEANYQRFCTNYMATAAEGFDRPILFANEEAQDWVFRTGDAWPGPDFIAPGTPGAEQAGVTAAYDVRTGRFRTIYGMGRLNHENTVAIPGYDDLTVVTTDDTFFTTQLAEPYKPAWSQLYTYIAPDTDALWNDEGELWAFVSDTAGYDDYFDFAPGDPTEIDGHFIQVPKDIAVGKDADGNDHLSGDFPGMLPPPAVGGAPPDGPQWVLDQWGNEENNDDEEDVFRFVRLEDIAYDKRPGMSNIIYIADTGRASRAPAGDLRPQPGLSTNGRIWRIELDPDNPTENAKLSILVEGDDNLVALDDKVGAFNEIHQPDNVETTANGSLLVQEDPSSANQYAFPREANETPARIWHIDLNAPDPDASKVTVAEVDQSLDEQPGYDVDGPQTSPPTIIRSNMGVWESSGIVDASAVFGPGAFLVTIQAHSLWIEKADGPDDREPPGKDYTFKREGGQLVLLRIPGA